MGWEGFRFNAPFKTQNGLPVGWVEPKFWDGQVRDVFACSPVRHDEVSAAGYLNYKAAPNGEHELKAAEKLDAAA